MRTNPGCRIARSGCRIPPRRGNFRSARCEFQPVRRVVIRLGIALENPPAVFRAARPQLAEPRYEFGSQVCLTEAKQRLNGSRPVIYKKVAPLALVPGGS